MGRRCDNYYYLLCLFVCFCCAPCSLLCYQNSLLLATTFATRKQLLLVDVKEKANKFFCKMKGGRMTHANYAKYALGKVDKDLVWSQKYCKFYIKWRLQTNLQVQKRCYLGIGNAGGPCLLFLLCISLPI